MARPQDHGPESLEVREDEPDPPGGLFGRIPGTTTISGVAQEYAGYMIWQRLAAMTDENTLVATLQSAAPRLARYGITSIQAMLTGQTAAVLAKGIAAAGVPLRWRLIDFPFQPMADWRQPQARPWDAGRSLASGHQVDSRRNAGGAADVCPAAVRRSSHHPRSAQLSSGGRQQFPARRLRRGSSRCSMPSATRRSMQSWTRWRRVAEKAAPAAAAYRTWRHARSRSFRSPKRFGIVVVQNPSHFMLPDVMKARLGDRVGRMTMMRSLIAADVPVALGSDGPPNPYLNMMFAITNAKNPAESMTREQVLAAYTMDRRTPSVKTRRRARWRQASSRTLPSCRRTSSPSLLNVFPQRRAS